MLTGSCLCGDTTIEIDGRWTPWANYHCSMHNCHCSRSRRAASAACQTVLRVLRSGFRRLAGTDSITRYQLPGTRFQCAFCHTCGSRTLGAGRTSPTGHTRFRSYKNPSRVAQPSRPDCLQEPEVGSDKRGFLDSGFRTHAIPVLQQPVKNRTAIPTGFLQCRRGSRNRPANRHRKGRDADWTCGSRTPGSGTRNCAFPPAASTAIRVRNRATTSSPIRAQRGPLWMKASRPGGKPRAGIAHQRISHSLPRRAVAYSSAVLRGSSFLSWKFRVVDPRLLSSRDHTRKPQVPACVHAQHLLVSLRASPLRRY